MSCLLTSGYTLGCRDSQGGLRNVYISNFDDVTSITLDGTGAVSAIVSGGSPATPTFRKFEQDMEVASFKETGSFSIENGTAFYTQSVELTMIKSDQTTLNLVKVLGQGQWRILVEDQNGNYRLVGVYNPVRVSGMDGGSGKALGDLNGSKITFECKEIVPSPTVSSVVALAHII